MPNTNLNVNAFFFTVIRIHNALNNDAEIIQDTKFSSSYHSSV